MTGPLLLMGLAVAGMAWIVDAALMALMAGERLLDAALSPSVLDATRRLAFGGLALILGSCAQSRTARLLGAATHMDGNISVEAGLKEAPIPIMIHAEDNEVILVNRKWTELTGFAEDEIPTTLAWANRAFSHDPAWAMTQIARLYDIGAAVSEGEFNLTAKGGERLIWDFRSSPLGTLPDGRRAVITMAMDVTQRHEAERELMTLYHVIERSPTLVLVTDREGRVEYANPRFLETTGLALADLRGKPPPLIFELFPTEGAVQDLENDARRGRITHREFKWPDGRGAELWIQLSVSGILGDEGNVTHYISLFEDVTERKRGEAELRRAKERAELANKAKSEFLAHMSHELRTPLNAVIGFSEVLQHHIFGALGSPRYDEYVRDIRASGDHLLRLINDILDLSKIEAGEFDLAEEEIEIAHVVSWALEMMRSKIEEAALALEVDLAPDLPRIRADERALRQILLNLLSNAVKFTPQHGTVMVSAACREKGGLHLSISDSGIGIPPDKVSQALEPFGQVESTWSRSHEGTGLGLPITKSLVELHGGSISIESVVDQGTTVFVEFPANRIARPVTA